MLKETYESTVDRIGSNFSKATGKWSGKGFWIFEGTGIRIQPEHLHFEVCKYNSSRAWISSQRPPPPAAFVIDGVNWPFFVCEFVKMKKKIVRELVKTISFVIRETKKYCS